MYLREAILKEKSTPESTEEQLRMIWRTSICTREENTGLDRTERQFSEKYIRGAKGKTRRRFLRQEPVHIRDTAGGKIADRKTTTRITGRAHKGGIIE